MEAQQYHHWKKYVAVFFITLGIFIAAIYLANSISNRKIAELRTIQDSVTTDILSSETRFALLEQTSCDHLVDDPILSEELGLFGARLASMERQHGGDDAEVRQVKRYYSLLQIKDFLLMEELAEKCDTKPVSILFFYEGNCPACERQGYVLSAITEQYPDVRVYSFDYNLELSALRTLISIYKVPQEELPVMVINGKLYLGFVKESDLQAMLDEYYPDTDNTEEDSLEEDTLTTQE